MRKLFPILFSFLIFLPLAPVSAQQAPSPENSSAPSNPSSNAADFFDDKALIQGYTTKLLPAPKDLLLAMINDEGLHAYRKAAAVKVFREKFAPAMVSRERVIIEKVLLQQLQRSLIVPLQIEILHTLVVMDRFRYYEPMVPIVVRKMDHYDAYVNELAYEALVNINTSEVTRPREARIVFNALRKIFFLSRKKLKTADTLDPKMHNKFELLRWAIKILGTEELKRLPLEVISLM